MTLNQDEQRRLLVLNEVIRGRLTAGRAGELLGLSERHLSRILAAYREEGAAALAHGNRGRRPVNALAESIKEQVLELARTKYAGFNHLHMSEMLIEEEKLPVGQSSARRILAEAGIVSPRKRRGAKHRSRRERYPKEGMLLQIDASPHDWLEGRGPAMSLIAGIDDATGTVPHGLFRHSEDSAGYFLLMLCSSSRSGLLLTFDDAHQKVGDDRRGIGRDSLPLGGIHQQVIKYEQEPIPDYQSGPLRLDEHRRPPRVPERGVSRCREAQAARDRASSALSRTRPASRDPLSGFEAPLRTIPQPQLVHAGGSIESVGGIVWVRGAEAPIS